MRNDAGINGDAQRIEQIAWMLFLKVYDAKEQDWEFDDSDYTSIIPEKCRWSNWAHDDKSGNAMTGDPLLDFVNNTLFPTLKNLPVTKETPIKKAIVQTTFADANNYMKDGVLLRQVLNVIDALDLGDYEESHAFGEIYETILKELQSAGSAGEFYTPRAVTDFMAKMIKPQIGEKMADFACGTGGFLTSWLKELEKQVKSVADQEEYGDSIYGIEKKQFPYMLCITNMLLHDIDVPRVFHDNSLTRDLLDYTDALRRQRKSGYKKSFSRRPRQQRDRRLVYGGHSLSLKAERTRGGDFARRFSVRHRQRENQHQEKAAQRLQPAHGHSYAVERVCALYVHHDEHFVF